MENYQDIAQVALEAVIEGAPHILEKELDKLSRADLFALMNAADKLRVETRRVWLRACQQEKVE